MKKLLVGSVLLAAALAPAQVKMRVFLTGKPVGTALLTQKLRPDGSKLVQLSMELVQGGNKINFRSESTYSADGMPIRKFQETAAPAQKFRRTRVATFDSKGANVVEELNGQRSSKQFPLEKTAPRADLSEFWFLRDKPKAGGASRAYVFNMESLVWELTGTTYEGQVELTLGGKKMKAHKTKSDKGIAFMDAQGDPLRLELPNGAMERIFE